MEEIMSRGICVRESLSKLKLFEADFSKKNLIEKRPGIRPVVVFHSKQFTWCLPCKSPGGTWCLPRKSPSGFGLFQTGWGLQTELPPSAAKPPVLPVPLKWELAKESNRGATRSC